MEYHHYTKKTVFKYHQKNDIIDKDDKEKDPFKINIVNYNHNSGLNNFKYEQKDKKENIQENKDSKAIDINQKPNNRLYIKHSKKPNNNSHTRRNEKRLCK